MKRSVNGVDLSIILQALDHLGTASKLVQCIGDSITTGDFNFADDSFVWFPQNCNQLINLDDTHTVVSDATELYTTAGGALVATTYAAPVYTMTSTAGEHVPRFVGGQVAVAAGEIYLLKAKINNAGAAGDLSNLRAVLLNAADATLASIYSVYAKSDLGGYTEFSLILDIDALLVTYPTLAKIWPGGIFATSSDGQVCLMKDFSLVKLSNYTAITNDGLTGEKASEFVTDRMAALFALNPDIVIISYGTNDIRAGVALPAFLASLTTIVNAAKAVSGIPILATIPPMTPDQCADAWLKVWNTEIKNLAYSLSVRVWDRYRAFDWGDLTYIDDGRHPTRAGYLRLADSLSHVLTGSPAI